MKKLLMCILFCGAINAQDNQLAMVMQNMEYAMNLMEKGFLYNRIDWIKQGLEDFKGLSKDLRAIDPHTYLGVSQRRNINVVSGIINRNQDNIEVMERFINKKEMTKSADAYGQILAGCVSCHAISRGW